MKKILSIVLCFALLLSFCNGFAMTAFAADGDITATVQGSYTKSEAEQDITIRLELPNVSEKYCAFYIDTGITLPDGFKIKSFTTSNTSNQIAVADYNSSSGTLAYDPVASTNSIPIGTYYDVLITAPANASGTFEVSFKDVCATDATYSNLVAEASVVTTTLTITDGSPGGNGGNTEGYTASMSGNSANAATIRVGNTIKIDLGVNAAYSATQMTVTYPSNLVTFDASNSALGTATVNSATAGTLELADYGVNKNADTDNYVLAFTAVSDGTASFELTSAKFGTGTTSENASLTVATLPSALSVVINKAQHTVTLPNIFAGATSVEDGASYTFKPETATGAFYDYATITVQMGESTVTATLQDDGSYSYSGNSDALTVSSAADGGWTIAKVTGNVTITGSRTAKTYGVTINTVMGDETATETKTATYGTAFDFVVPADVAAGEDVGYTYVLGSVTINGESYDDYTNETGTRNYSIPGTDIIGDIVITIQKTEQPANTFRVDISGDAAGEFDPSAETVGKNNNVTITFTPDDGYTYTFTIGGVAKDMDDWTENGDGSYSYTIENVQSADDVKIVVAKDLTMTYAKAYQYVQLNGTVMWLVEIKPDETGTQISGSTYTYNGANMYWSPTYKSYVTLIVATSEPALENFALAPVNTVPTITYDNNVNMSTDNLVDAADAQLVWNMYNSAADKTENTENKYGGFTENVTIDKFLKADVNGDYKIDTNDAVAIIKAVLRLQ